ncbi:MAG: 5-formyltetrahydrofolate cyclo-ligase [Desulfovibrionaceae bacterium]
MQPAPGDKAALRATMLTRRQALSAEAVAAASAAVTARVLALPQWGSAREILAYLPVRGEVDTRELVTRAIREGRRLLAPRCRENAPGLVDLGCLTCLEDAFPGRFGIPEPAADRCQPPEAFAPDLILVPGVAFDPAGTRLGFGGGYYDRLLALPMAAGATVVGLCHAFQFVDHLPAAAWDKPMHIVITERTTHWCHS